MRSKVFFAFVLSLIASCLSLYAQTVSPEAARAKAMDFFSTGAKNLPARKGAMRKAPAVSNVELAYTSKKDGKTCFYVYNNGTDGGFVIVGGDEVAQEILAYSDHGHFDYDKAPENFKDMLSQYTEQISLAKPVAKSLPAKTPAKVAAATTVQKEDIPDLIETTWDQWDPYNRAIPKLVNSNTGEEFTPPTGCVPTAAAQVMKYWNYPEHGVGQETRILNYSQINAYTSDFTPTPETPEFGTIVHDINFENTTYDWTNMLTTYTGKETAEQINAVSTLMYHTGIACKAFYGIDMTSASNLVEGLQKHFDYSPKAKEISRDKFDNQTWEEIIYTELKENRPVLYFGVGEGLVGHEYIIHGYSSEYDMYKVNWGWGGSMDCYCKLTPTIGEVKQILLGYNQYQEACLRLQPASMDSNSSLGYGDTFWTDGIKYTIISSAFKTVEVAHPERTEPQYEGSITIPETVNYQGTDYTVIGLGEKCFEVLTYIYEDGAEGWHPWESQISEINLPHSLRYIRSEAFNGCGNIEHIEIPSNVKHMGKYAFSNCLNLKTLTLSSNLKEIPEGCFAHCRSLECLDVPEGVITIGEESFKFCEGLNRLTLPSSLKVIGNDAFAMTNSLDVLMSKASTPPTLISHSQENPFTANAASGYLLVPENAIESYKDAQYWNKWKNILSIDSIDISAIGETVTIDDIEYRLWPDGAEVTNVLIYFVPKITIPDVITIKNKDYNVISLGSELHFYCDSVVLPQNLTTIKAHAFGYSSTVKELRIPASVTAIGSYAFEGLGEVQKVILPESLEEVPEDCFSRNNNLSVLEFPKNVKTINYSAIRDCDRLFTIVCRAEEVPAWDNSIHNYYNYTEGTLYVPGSSIDKYRSSEHWKDFRFIKSIDEYDENEHFTSIDYNGLTYELLNHGAVVLGHSENITETDISIPEIIEYEGKSYNVISIGSMAFQNQTTIETVHLPSSMHSILRYSFFGCTGLKNIVFPDNIEYIGESAFENCNLKQINIPESLKIFGCSFKGTAIEKLIIPEGVEELENDGGFFKMASLKDIVLPSTLNVAGDIWINSNTERIYILSPGNIPDFATVGNRERHATAFVPVEYLEECREKNEENILWSYWNFNEVLPIIPLTSVRLNEEEMALATGKRSTLAAESSPADASLKYVKWSSSDPTIASVDQNGVVTARKSGTVTITVTSMYYPDVTATCTVTVKAGTVGTLVDAIDGLPSGRTTLQDVDDAVDSILER